jgi:hypothetical protein
MSWVCDMKVDASSIHLETPLAGALVLLHFCFFARRGDFVLLSIAFFARRHEFVLLDFWLFAGCDEFVGQVGNLRPIVNRPTLEPGTMPEKGQGGLRLAAMRARLFNPRPIVDRPGRLRTVASRRVDNPPQDAILPHVRAIPLSCRTPE